MKKNLLVEDEISVVTFVKKSLQELDYELSVAFQGQTSLKMTLNNNFNVIILDILLPDING